MSTWKGKYSVLVDGFGHSKELFCEFKNISIKQQPFLNYNVNHCDEQADFEFASGTEVYQSCSIVWKDEMLVFGGKTQSVVLGYSTVFGPNNGIDYFRNFSQNNGISWIPLFSNFSIRAKITEF